MTFIIDRNAANVVADVRVSNDAGAPITGMTHATAGLSVAYLVDGGAAWVTIALSAATFSASAGGDGWYRITLPNAAIVAGKTTRLRVGTAGNGFRYGSVSATGGGTSATADPAAIAQSVMALLRPTAESFRGARQLQELNSVSLVQRDDYVAADGRAFEWTVVNPSIDYTAATIEVGPVGGGTSPNAPTLLGTATLRDKLNGSCTLRIEFSAAQTNVAAGTYNLQALILVSTRRVTSAQISVTVAPAYADAPPA